MQSALNKYGQGLLNTKNLSDAYAFCPNFCGISQLSLGVLHESLFRHHFPPGCLPPCGRREFSSRRNKTSPTSVALVS